MAEVLAPEALQARFTPGAPYGNTTTLHIPMETTAAGVLIGSNQNTALLQTDTVQFATLGRGTVIGLSARVVVSDAFTALTTISLGFRYVDGVDLAAPYAEDPDFILQAAALSSVARIATNKTVQPIRLTKDAYLIGTLGGADHASAGRADFFIQVLNEGDPSNGG